MAVDEDEGAEQHDVVQDHLIVAVEDVERLGHGCAVHSAGREDDLHS